jgi:hypothetical protein
MASLKYAAGGRMFCRVGANPPPHEEDCDAELDDSPRRGRQPGRLPERAKS